MQNTFYKREAGGVLLGRYIRESLDIVIDQVTVPMKGDRRQRFSFFRDHHRHQRAIDRAWQETRGTTHYLGEWHTHPESIPIPSNTDLKDWQCRLKQDVFSGNALYFVIVGTETLRIWEGDKNSLACQLIGEFQYSEEIQCQKQRFHLKLF